MKLIIYALIAYAAWTYYQEDVAPIQLIKQIGSSPYQPAITPITQAAQSYSCDGRQYCTQMRSRAEAEYFIKNCPNTKMDGDNDGEPCENDSRF